jgi:hypothetical protein
MATASRSRAPAGAKRPSRAPVPVLLAVDTLRAWAIPAVAGLTIAVLAALDAAEMVATPIAVAITIAASLLLLLYIGERPLVTAERSARDRLLGGALAVVWFLACYTPFHARLFPGRPLVDNAQITSSGSGLPLRIPATGARAVDFLLEGKLTPSAAGGVAPPLHYVLTIEDDAGAHTIDGTFEDRLATRRLGRRGTAVVHQTHTADVRLLPNPRRGDLRVTHLMLEPESTQPITVSAFAHPLPGPVVLGLAILALLAAVVAFDRLGPVPETDGALTLSTAAAIGTAFIFWTSNAVRPDYPALIGSAIFGGPIGFAIGACIWWMAKRLIVRPAR